MTKNNKLFIFLNLIIILDMLVILISVAPKIPSFFHYFTVLSNIFMALIAIPAILTIIKKKSTKNQIKKISNLYLMATTSLILVFLVVVLFLGPQSKNYFSLFKSYNFFMHFLNPLFATISIFLLKKPKYNLKSRLLTLLPPLIYAGIYLVFVIIKEDWPDIYNFTFGGKKYFAAVSLLTILTTTFLIATILSAIINKNSKRKKHN